MHNLKQHNYFVSKRTQKKKSQRKKNNNSNSNVNNKPSHSYLLVFNFLHFSPFPSFLPQLVYKVCKVEFNQPSCWLYSVPNLLVF